MNPSRSSLIHGEGSIPPTASEPGADRSPPPVFFPLIDEPRIVIVGCPLVGCSEDLWRIQDGSDPRILRKRAASHFTNVHPALTDRQRSLLADQVVRDSGLEG